MSHHHVEELNIVMTPNKAAENGYLISLVSDAHIFLTHSDSINLGKHEVRCMLGIPDRMELAQLAIDTLKEKQKDIAAEAYRRQQELEEKIKSLLLIGTDHEDSL